MKPESVDDGSLEKLAEKAADKLILDFWDEFQLGQFAPEEIKAIGENLESSFLSALSEATAALEEKEMNVRSLTCCHGNIMDICDVCNETPTPVLQVSEPKELAAATTRSPMGVVSEESGHAMHPNEDKDFDWWHDRVRELELQIERLDPRRNPPKGFRYCCIVTPYRGTWYNGISEAMETSGCVLIERMLAKDGSCDLFAPINPRSQREPGSGVNAQQSRSVSLSTKSEGVEKVGDKQPRTMAE